jgi:hypothetical protein
LAGVVPCCGKAKLMLVSSVPRMAVVFCSAFHASTADCGASLRSATYCGGLCV